MVETSFFNECPQFFKVFMPQFSSKRLQIPPAFVRRHLKESQKEVTLRDHNGKLWRIGLVIIEKYLYFGINWDSFVREHSLVLGDFLIFKLHGNLLFSVKLFGRDGCNKDFNASKIIPNNTTIVKTEQVEEEHPPCTASAHANKSTPTGKKGFNRSTKESAKLNQHKTKKTAATLVKKHKRNPCFESKISDSASSKAWVCIPRSVLKEVKLCPEIVLCNENNKKWPVKFVLRKDGRSALTIGWPEFRKQNNLKANDKYVFELVVVGKENKCSEIKVMKVSKRSERCVKVKI
ncbi:putative B3 domain-containing protein At5g66980 [Humulus lupulus]|uniref:putative B3 domain-containing protein At5g66980 n=1 Tax=Humulus lupulus TaxID=3486 RepID=UPI002B40E3E3|nr:putative B3 domain-containing protein At5g66980 [Humulus lupulus]